MFLSRPNVAFFLRHIFRTLGFLSPVVLDLRPYDQLLGQQEVRA